MNTQGVTGVSTSDVGQILTQRFGTGTGTDNGENGAAIQQSTLTALYNSSGTYVGSYGIDPSTGAFAAWDASGNETSFQAFAAEHQLASGATPIASDGGNAVLYDASGQIVGLDVAGYVVNTPVSAESSSSDVIDGETTVYDRAGNLLGSFGYDATTGTLELNGTSAVSALEQQGFSAAIITQIDNQVRGRGTWGPSSLNASIEQTLTEMELSESQDSQGTVSSAVYQADGNYVGGYGDVQGTFTVYAQNGVASSTPVLQDDGADAGQEAQAVQSINLQGQDSDSGNNTNLIQINQALSAYLLAQGATQSTLASAVDVFDTQGTFVGNIGLDSVTGQFAVEGANDGTVVDVSNILSGTSLNALQVTKAQMWWGKPSIPGIGQSGPVGKVAEAAADLDAVATTVFNGPFVGLSLSQIAALTASQLSALSAPQVLGITASQINALSPIQIAALNGAGLSATALSGLTAASVQSLSAAQLSVFDAQQATGLGTLANLFTGAQLGSLSTQGIIGLTSQAIVGFSPAQLQSLTGSQLSAFSSTQFAALSAQQLASFSAQQVGYLGSNQLGELSNQQVQALNLSGLDAGALTQSQLASFSTIQLGSLSAAQVEDLNTWEVNGLSTQQIQSLNTSDANLEFFGDGYLSQSSVQSLSVNQIGGLSASQIGSMGDEVEWLTPAQTAALSPGALAGVAPAYLSGFTTSQIAALTTTQIGSLTNAQISALTSSQISSLSSAQTSALIANEILGSNGSFDVSALTTAQIDALTPGLLGALTAAQVATFDAAQINSLSTPQVQALNISALWFSPLNGFSQSTTQSLTLSQVAQLSANQVGWLNTAAEYFTPAQIAALTPSSLSGLGPETLSAFTAPQIQAFTAAQIGAITTAQVSALSVSQVAALTTAQVTALSSGQIQALSISQVNSLLEPQVQALTASQLAAFSDEQLESLTVYQTAVLYVSQLADLSSGQLGAIASAVDGSLTAAAEGNGGQVAQPPAAPARIVPPIVLSSFKFANQDLENAFIYDYLNSPTFAMMADQASGWNNANNTQTNVNSASLQDGGGTFDYSTNTMTMDSNLSGMAEDDDMGHEMGHLFDYATDPEGYLTDMATLLSAENINVPNPSDNAETPTLEESNGFAWELDVASEIGGEGAFTGPDWFTAGSTSSYGQMVTFENSIMPPDTDHDFWVPSNVPSAFDSVPDTTLPTIPNIPLIGLSPDAIAEIAFSNQMASEDNASFESMSASGDLQIDVSGYPT